MRPITTTITRAVSVAMLGLAAPALAQLDQGEDWRKQGLAEPAVVADPLFGPFEPSGGEIAGFPADNVTLMSWLPVGWFPGDHRSANDCWGYVSPSGREYAMIGLHSAFAVLEVTDPTYPELIGTIPGNGSTWRDIKVIGEYAYGVSESGLGIQVIDLSDVDQGVVRHVRNRTQSGHSSTHNIASNPDSGYLYLCGANISNGGLVAVDTANPELPTIRGAWSQRYVHDAQIVSYTSGPYAGREIAFCCCGSRGVYIVDVTNKNNMFTIASHRYSGTHYCHQAWVSDDLQYLYVNDEMDEGSSFSQTTTHVLDISNLSNPREITTFTSGSAATDHNLYVKGDIAFEANYRSGLRVFNISDPMNVEQIAYLDTAPSSDEPGYHGAWSTYPYFPSGTVLISDIERGLFMLRLGASGLAFEFPDGLPDDPRPGLPTSVAVSLLEQGSQLDADSVELVVRRDGEEERIPLVDDGEGVFRGELPSGDCFETIEYWFTASDSDGLSYIEPFNAPISGGHRARITTGSSEEFHDDFAADRGWTVDNGDVIQGGWARTAPQGGSPYEPSTDADGSDTAYLTGEAPSEHLLGGPIHLYSPVFDLSELPEAEFSFAVWFAKGDLGAIPMAVELSDDGGFTWDNVLTVGPTDGWERHTLRVADFVAPSSSIRVRFAANNSFGVTEVEAGVDDFRLATPLCDPCIADYNNDGTVNTLDVLAYLNDFTGATDEGEPDLNGDGVVNTLDLLLFLNLFTAGC